MDRPAAYAMLAAIPVLCLVFFTTTRLLPPLVGYLVGMTVYWFLVLTPLLIWRGGLRIDRLRIVWPARWLVMINVMLILGVAIAATFELRANTLSLWVPGIVTIAALLNGTLEELFWRGTLLHHDASGTDQALQLLLFVGWHIALLFSDGIVVTGGAFGLLGGAAIGGALWTYTRMLTGSAGFGALSHVGLNLFAFAGLAAQNL
ncbi:CPBP family glutamic-type intramembrane protease [Yoonia sp. 2307UL14-13]|uniref:CPBP family glutamic-type intramembrane protease n=1 Tax=Yoonia sp. 2307UL14-13 TaxID=3126506 RepID=UPI00309EECA1